MIEIVVPATLIASVSSASTAYFLARAKHNRTKKPSSAEEIATLFPNSSIVMPAFKRAVEARAKAKIRPMIRREAKLMKQYDKIVSDLVEAKRGNIKERKVLAAGKVCWSIIKVYERKFYWPRYIKSSYEAYSHLVALNKGKMTEDFIDQICSLVEVTFYVHAKRFIDTDYDQVVSLDNLQKKFEKIVNRELSGITSGTNN